MFNKVISHVAGVRAAIQSSAVSTFLLNRRKRRRIAALRRHHIGEWLEDRTLLSVTSIFSSFGTESDKPGVPGESTSTDSDLIIGLTAALSGSDSTESRLQTVLPENSVSEEVVSTPHGESHSMIGGAGMATTVTALPEAHCSDPIEFIRADTSNHMSLATETFPDQPSFNTTSPFGEIRGTKFEDRNENGEHDDDEPGLAGVTIYLDLNDDGILNTHPNGFPEPSTTTDSNGDYVLTGLFFTQEYIVREIVPEGYRQTYPVGTAGRLFAINSNMTGPPLIVELDSATGATLNSFSGPGMGVGDTGGLAFDGQTIYFVASTHAILYELDPDTGAVRDSMVLNSTSGHDGIAVLDGLVFVNDHLNDVIQVIDPTTNTLVRTIVPPASDPLPFDGLGELPDRLGGLLIAPAEISDAVALLSPYTGEAFCSFSHGFSAGSVVGATSIDSKIYLGFDDPDGTVGVYSDGGVFERSFQVDFDISGLAAANSVQPAHRVMLSPGHVLNGVDFGNHRLTGSIIGTTFEDIDGNGQRDAGEGPLPGVTIYLDINDNRVNDTGEPTTVTDINGNYTFSDVPTGDYAVREVVMADVVQTTPAPDAFFYAVASAADELITIDAITGRVDHIGLLGTNIDGFVRTRNGDLFAVRATGTDSFYSVDATTGTATLVGATGQIAFGLAYDEANDIIYTIRDLGSTLNLATIDRTTGVTTVIGPGTGRMSGASGLVFDAANNRVIAFDNRNRNFWGYDVITGEASLLFSAALSLSGFGFTYTGTDFVMSTTAGQLVVVDPSTFVVTPFLTMSEALGVNALDYVRATEGSYRVTVRNESVRDHVDFGNQRRALTVSIANRPLIAETGAAATATVTRNGDTMGDLIVTLSSNDSSEVSFPVTTIVIPDGAATSAPFVIQPVDDAVVDGTQTVVVTASSPNHLDGASTLKVIDRDRAALSITDIDGVEGDTFTFTVVLDHAVEGGFDVAAMLTGHSALDGLDYVNPNATLNFLGHAGEAQRFTIDTVDDDRVENIENFLVTFQATNNHIDDTDSAFGTITDNDSAVVSIAGELRAEGTDETPTPFTFTISLSAPVDAAVALTAGTRDKSATAANDYTPINDTGLVFPANSTAPQTIKVDVNADSNLELDEAFDLVLSELMSEGLPVSFEGGQAMTSAAATILNDDRIQIINDGDPGFSTTGNWPRVTNKPQVQGGDFRYNVPGPQQSNATWRFDAVEPGLYRVSTSYRSFANRATNAPFSISDGATKLTIASVNQQQAANSLTDGGIGFHDLGVFNVLNGSLSVQLTNLADGVVIADAIRIERLGDVIPGPEVQVTVDGNELKDGIDTVDFGDVEADRATTKVFTVTNLGTTDLVLNTPITVPPGFTLTSGFSSTVLAPFEIATFEITVDTSNPGGQSGQVSFGNNDVDDVENPFNFLIKANVVPATGVQIIDNGDVGFSTVGTWVEINGNRRGHGNDFRYANSGTGSNSASWAFDVVPGQYRVAATWREHSNRSAAAPYTIFNDTAEILTTSANQLISPGGINADGSSFTNLGLFNITSTKLVVTLRDNTQGLVVADAIRIERIGDIPAGPEIGVIDNGSNVPDGTGVVDFGDVELGNVDADGPAVRTLTIVNLGTETLNLTEPILTSAGVAATNFGATSLLPNASTTFDLHIDTSMLGLLHETVSFGSNDTDESVFDFAVRG